MRRMLPIAIVVLAAPLAPAPGRGDVAATVGATRILYASNWTGHMEIFAVDPSGKNPVRQLTFGTEPGCSNGLLPPGYVQPIPSPDGRHVLYGCGNSWHGPSLWVARADGRRPRRLVEPDTDSAPGPGGVFGAAWSPDSKQIAYSASDGLHLVRPDGSRQRVLYPGLFGEMAWSPDGRSLAALVGDDLFLLRRGRRVLLRRDAGLQIAWSPTGRWIATWYYRPYERPDRVVALTDASGASGPHVGVGRLAAWAPDGRRLAYEAPDGLRVLELRTGRSKLLTRETAYARAYDERPLGLAWSPDGRSIAYVAGSLDVNEAMQSGDLRTVTLGGRVRTVVPRDRRYGGRMLSPAWTRPPAGLRYRAPEPAPATRAAARDVLADGPITGLAADGGRVAFIACLGAFVWTPATRELTEIQRREWPDHPGPAPCYQPDRSYFYALAVAGDRVAYGERRGCTGTLALGLGLVGSPGQVTELARSNVTCAAPMKPALAGLEGAGDLLAYSAALEDAPCCPLGTTSTAVQSIHRVSGAGCPCPAIASSNGPYVPADVDAGRVVAYGDNETHVLDAEGLRLLSIPVSPAAARLSGPDLVLLLRGELRVYDAASGALRRTWPLPDVPSGGPCELRCGSARLVLQDVARGLAAYVLDRQVHLLRLADGTDAIVAAGTHARFMDAGLVYADGWRLHLVPFDRLPLS
jgi:Tol biopolymer transport system component